MKIVQINAVCGNGSTGKICVDISKLLTEKGIDKGRITKEDRSTSTMENLRFTKEILEQKGRNTEVILVTDGFHQCRASLQARSLGYDTRNLSSDTPWFLLPSYWVREWFALSYEFVFG